MKDLYDIVEFLKEFEARLIKAEALLSDVYYGEGLRLNDDGILEDIEKYLKEYDLLEK